MHIILFITSIISKEHPHKACENDGIPEIDLKKCTPELFPVFAKLYNKYLTASCFAENPQPKHLMLLCLNLVSDVYLAEM